MRISSLLNIFSLLKSSKHNKCLFKELKLAQHVVWLQCSGSPSMYRDVYFKMACIWCPAEDSMKPVMDYPDGKRLLHILNITLLGQMAV